MQRPLDDSPPEEVPRTVEDLEQTIKHVGFAEGSTFHKAVEEEIDQVKNANVRKKLKNLLEDKFIFSPPF